MYSQHWGCREKNGLCSRFGLQSFGSNLRTYWSPFQTLTSGFANLVNAQRAGRYAPVGEHQQSTCADTLMHLQAYLGAITSLLFARFLLRGWGKRPEKRHSRYSFEQGHHSSNKPGPRVSSTCSLNGLNQGSENLISSGRPWGGECTPTYSFETPFLLP